MYKNIRILISTRHDTVVFKHRRLTLCANIISRMCAVCAGLKKKQLVEGNCASFVYVRVLVGACADKSKTTRYNLFNIFELTILLGVSEVHDIP